MADLDKSKKFLLVTSNSNWPSDDGIGFTASDSDVPFELGLSVLGNVGTGDPEFPVEVKFQGEWVPISDPRGVITNNESRVLHGVGSAFRVAVPALNTPGTGATAPRIAYRIVNLLTPHHGLSS